MKGYSDSSAVLQLADSPYKSFAVLDTPQLFLKQEFISEPSCAACTEITQVQSDYICDNRVNCFLDV